MGRDREADVEKLLAVAEQKEAEQAKNKEETDGYSEKQQALDTESRSGDLHALKRSSSLQTSQQGLVGSTDDLDEYHKISQTLAKLVASYTKLIEDDLHQAQKLLEDIHTHQKIQQKLFEKLIGKQMGS